MPSSIAPMITSSSEDSPCLWPSVLGSPRLAAQRPSPSITRATCLGTSARGMSGGLAPLGCGSGGRTTEGDGPCFISDALHVTKGTDRMLKMPLKVRGHQATALYPVPSVAAVGVFPVALQ